VNVDALAAVPIFEGLGTAELEVLAPRFREESVSESVRLIGEGASGYSFFVLVEGSVVVTSGETTVSRLGPGDFFGEMALLGEGRRLATVTTTSPARLLVLFGTEFRRLQQEHPEIATRIEQTMRDRIAELPAPLPDRSAPRR
jgi:CRP-like cAMP-binding protein